MNAFTSTGSATSVSQIFSFTGLPPGTFPKLFFLRAHLFLDEAYSYVPVMAKLKKPGLLISPSSLVRTLTSSWLSGETENDHPEVQRVWDPN